jgi:hypothetical protein
MDRSAGRVDGSDSILGMRLTAHLVDALVRKLLIGWKGIRGKIRGTILKENKPSQVCRKSLSSSGVLWEDREEKEATWILEKSKAEILFWIEGIQAIMQSLKEAAEHVYY